MKDLDEKSAEIIALHERMVNELVALRKQVRDLEEHLVDLYRLIRDTYYIQR